jgi:hypothetical protein
MACRKKASAWLAGFGLDFEFDALIQAIDARKI